MNKGDVHIGNIESSLYTGDRQRCTIDKCENPAIFAITYTIGQSDEKKIAGILCRNHFEMTSSSNVSIGYTGSTT